MYWEGLIELLLVVKYVVGFVLFIEYKFQVVRSYFVFQLVERITPTSPILAIKIPLHH